MRTYIAYFVLAFRNNTIYRVQYLLGILNTCLQIFVLCAIWKALYMGKEEVAGISYMMVTTNFIITQGLNNAFAIDDLAVQQKLYDGSIAVELLKPIDFRMGLLARNLGEITFKLVTNFLPTVIIGSIWIGVLPPAGVMNGIYFAISIILGFAILWAISNIVQMTAFWILNVWSISILKNIMIGIFSGTTLPIWFMPDFIQKIISYTPIGSIYFTPIEIYLGRLELDKILRSYAVQLCWFIGIYIIATLMWQHGKKRIIVQGG